MTVCPPTNLTTFYLKVGVVYSRAMEEETTAVVVVVVVVAVVRRR